MNERNTEVGTNGGLSQRWREAATWEHEHSVRQRDEGLMDGAGYLSAGSRMFQLEECAKQLDAAKLRIEEAVKALPHDTFMDGPTFKEYERHREDCRMCAMLKITREIL